MRCVTAQRRRPAPDRPAWRESLVGYAFASPFLIGFFGLTLVPMIASLALSFAEWDGINLGQIEWVGADQYARAWSDDNVAIALWNTGYYAFLSVPLGLAVALLLAVMLNQPLKGIGFFRTLYYMPHIIGGVATIMMWLWVFNPGFGLMNAALLAIAEPLQAIGLVSDEWRPPNWFHSKDWSKPALILMSVWGSGGAMLIFLAALQNVPDQLYEAARVDGAGRARQFWHVTVPQITPAIFFNLVMGVIGSFQVFTEAYIISDGSGGPERSTLFYVLYLYNKAFRDFEMGYASALAWILFVIILAFTMIVVKSSSLWVYYEGER